MKFIKHAIIAGTLAFATLNVASAAPILNISPSDFTLLGASGVNVGGTLYDVTFADGMVDASAITAFTTAAEARAASQALLDQVFTGSYDSLTYITNGCSFGVNVCSTITPFAIDGYHVSYSSAVNYGAGSPGPDKAAEYVIWYPRFNTGPMHFYTIARWTPVAAIPEPETYAMMLAGLGLSGFVSRRRKQKAAV